MEESSKLEPLRVGTLMDGERLAAWQAACVEEVAKLDFVTFGPLVINEGEPPVKASFARKLGRNLRSGRLLWRAYERLVLDPRTRATMLVDLPEALRDAVRIRVRPVKAGKFRQRFDDEALSRLREQRVDVLLRFGFGILTGEVLSLPRCGVWSFHHGDPRRFRGAPPGFWEIHSGDPVTGVILQRLTETLDGGVILREGHFKTNSASYPRSLDRILFGAAHFVAGALGELHRDEVTLLARRPMRDSGPVYRYPNNRAMLRFFGRSAAALLHEQFYSLFRHQQWTLGVLDRPIAVLGQGAADGSRPLTGVRWLPEQKGRFLADPFALAGSDGSLRVLAEEYDWRAGRGHIAALASSAAGVLETDSADAIRSRHHLSYPFLIEHRGEIYCVPECAESNALTLHRLDRSSGCWTPDAVLLDGFPAVDPTIFQHDGRWWLFCTSATAGANEVLHAWYATDLRGPWAPHAANPVLVDIRSARPAGTPFLNEAGRLIRPGQDCSRQYGGGVAFKSVVELTPERFAEEAAGVLAPEQGRYRAGVHTVCAAGGQTLVDGARWAFVPAEMARSLGRKFGTKG